ncbi:MAG: hypothetical protein PHX87_06325 [Candidatus Peribacteraceae bacterium]|nr:hypothetical protein [Candidatus Peribacteraceae bacterium]MDD5743007.1 hypothetical protein [Candidatus Peribacteraceae bacterium]
MSSPASLFGSLWFVAVSTDAGKLFLFSSFLLLLGLLLETWSEGCGLQSLARLSLKEIETSHPHVPALFAIAQILCTSVPLFAVSLLLLRGFGFLPDTRTWMLFASIFLVVLTASVLAELHWRSMAHASFAFSTGTTTVFLWILFKEGLPSYAPLAASLLALFLAASVLVVGILSFRRRNTLAPILLLFTVVFWLCIAAFLA